MFCKEALTEEVDYDHRRPDIDAMGYPAQGYLREAVGRPSKMPSIRWTMPKANLDAPCYAKRNQY